MHKTVFEYACQKEQFLESFKAKAVQEDLYGKSDHMTIWRIMCLADVNINHQHRLNLPVPWELLCSKTSFRMDPWHLNNLNSCT